MQVEELRSIQDVLASIDETTTSERLLRLKHSLTVTRHISRYAHWSDEEVQEALDFIDSKLPKKLRNTSICEPKKRRARPSRQPWPALEIAGLEAFSRNLPYRPYVSNDLSHGLQIRGRENADLYRYIQHNPPAKCHWLVFDCDYPNALARVAAQKLPLPNYVATNPANGHSHLFYGLEDPVCTSEAGQGNKPLWILQRVEHALRELLEADPGYQGFICKNLLNEHWQVERVRSELWKLLEFKEHFELPRRLPKAAAEQGVGRNVTLFNTVRRIAYKQVLAYRLTGSKDAFKAYVLRTVEEHNRNFPAPLYAAEVASLAKSIANWTWTKYTARDTDERFKKRQAARGKQGGLAKGQANAEKRSEAVLMASQGMSVREIAAVLKVGKTTVHRWV